MTYPETLEILPLQQPPRATIQVPGSKSISNRALVLAALSAKGFAFALRGALQSEDTEVMIDCLRALGFRVLTDWPDGVICVSSADHEPTIPASQADLFVGNSGTTMRFLTAMVSLGHGRYRLDGVPRMRERPIEDLLAGLRQLGVRAYSEHNNGCPPVIVEASGLAGGTVKIKGDVSSQFLSGLLMAAPYARDPVLLEVEGPLVSRPYVAMTLAMLREWGFAFHENPHPSLLPILTGKEDPTVKEDEEPYRILFSSYDSRSKDEAYLDQAQAAAFHEGYDPRRHTWLREYAIEPDATAASYFLAAAAISGGAVHIPGLTEHSLQGDVRFADLLEEMGCRVERKPAGLTVFGGPLRGIDADLNDISDTVMTLAAVACFADGPTTIRNVAHIRHKETDRLAALATELRRLGAAVEELADGLKIAPRSLRGAPVETYDDHRLAMSLALIGLRVPGLVLKNPSCVAKTYPRFFDDLAKLRP